MVTAIAGLVASSAGKCVMHPIDTIKAKLQVITLPENLIGGGEMKSGGEIFKPEVGKSVIMQVARDTIKKEGIRGLYKGFAIHVGGSFPAGGLYFGGYEMFKKISLQYPYL